MNLFRLKPTRSAHTDDTEIVSDLDALVAKPIAFKWGGEKYTIRPFTTEQFFKFSQSLNELDKLAKQKGQSDTSVLLDEWVSAYVKMFRVACPEITREDVEEMTQGQVAALFNLILECVAGKAQADIEKKKIAELKQQQATVPNPTN